MALEKLDNNPIELEDEKLKARLLSSLEDAALDDEEEEEFERLNLAMRIQHVVMVLCFFTLVVTGLPMLFPESRLARAVLFFPQAFWFRGLIHRVAGVGLIGVSIFQVIYIILSEEGNRDFKKVLPQLQDAKDAVGMFLYNLGIQKEHPKFGKFTFIEKFEYMAVMWGNIIMIATGLMLWFQEASIALFPMWVLDIVRLVHGFEAMLAFLAIIIWHMYNVHLNPEVFPMSKVWLTGKISKEEMIKHHPLEYEEIMRERRQKRELAKLREIKGLLEGRSRKGTAPLR